MVGAPKGTMKKDLPNYFSALSSQVAQKEKAEDLYMKATAQASNDIENFNKNAGVFSMKLSPAQAQAGANKLRDNIYQAKAQGNILIKASDGTQHWIPAQNIGAAKKIDPNLEVQP